MAGHARALSRASSDAVCPSPDERKGAHRRSSRRCVLGASDPGEKIGELFLDLASQFGACPRNTGKVPQALEWPAAAIELIARLRAESAAIVAAAEFPVVVVFAT